MSRLLTTVSVIANKLVIQDRKPQTRDDKINGLVILTTLKQYEIMNKISFGILLDQNTDRFCKFSISFNLTIAKGILLEKFQSNPGVDALQYVEITDSTSTRYYHFSPRSSVTEPLLSLAAKEEKPSFNLNILWHAYLDYEGCLHVPIPDNYKNYLSLFTNYFIQTIDLIRVKRPNPIHQVAEDSINFEILLTFKKPPTRLELLNELHFIINPQKYHLCQSSLDILIILENTIRDCSRMKDSRVLKQETLTASSIERLAFAIDEPQSIYDLKTLLDPSQFKTEVYMDIPKLSEKQAANATAVVLNMIISNSNLQNEVSVSSKESKKTILLTFHNPKMWKEHLLALQQLYQIHEARKELDPYNVFFLQFDKIIKSAISISLDKNKHKVEPVARALRKKLATFFLHHHAEVSLVVDNEQNKIILLFNPDKADLLFPKFYNLLIKEPKPSSSRKVYTQPSSTPPPYHFFSFNAGNKTFEEEKEEEEFIDSSALNSSTRQPFSGY